jgi:hypothetical protein
MHTDETDGSSTIEELAAAAAAILAGVARNRVLNLRSAGELTERVGLIRANKKGHTNEGSTIWPGLGAWRGKA